MPVGISQNRSCRVGGPVMPGRGALALAVVVTAALVSVLVPEPYFFDFSIYWKAVEHLTSGKNPYDLPHFATYVSSAPDAPSTSGGNMVVMTLPFPLAVLAPFGLFSLPVAKRIFLFVQLLAVAAGLSLCWRMWAADLWATGRRRAALVLVAVAPVGFWLNGLGWGSPSWILFVGMCLFLALARSERWVSAGAALALLFAKLHLFVPWFAALLAWPGGRAHRRLWAGILVGTIALLVPLLLLDPRIGQQYAELASTGIQFRYTSASLPSILAAITRSHEAAIMAVSPLVAAIAAVFVTRRLRSQSVELLAAILLPASLLFAPSAWGHDFVVCIPAAVVGARFALDHAGTRVRDRAVIALVALGLSAVLSLGFALHFYLPGWGHVVSALPLLIASFQVYRMVQDNRTGRGK